MKYCTKCGHQMADDMLFCQKCGAKSEPIKTEQTAAPQHTEVKAAAPQQTYTVPVANTQTTPGNKKVKIRKGMKVGMIICFVFAAIYGLISIAESSIFAMTLFFFVLGLMFLSLGLVPKESKYMYLLGKPCKLKKSLFVVISIIAAFVICGISMSINPPEATTDNPASQQQQNNDVGSDPSSNESKNDQQSATENKPQEDKTTLNNTTQSNPSDKDNSSKPNDSQSGNSGETPTTQPNNSSDKPTTPHTHSYSSWEYYDEARHYRPCSSCSESEYEAHKWSSGTTTTTASCAQEGTITYICTVCNAEKYESIPMVEHKWDNGTVTQNATCSKEGTMTYSCVSCGAEKYDSIPKTSHEFSQKVESSDYLKSHATFTDGSVYYYSCSCGAKGNDTFSLNDKKVWISAEQLKSKYDLSYWWNGEEIQLYNNSSRYIISGSPKSSFEKDKIYTGSCNGCSVRFKYSQVTSSNSGNTFFHYGDLVAAGII